MTLTQSQVLSMLCNMFFGLFADPPPTMPSVSFSSILNQSSQVSAFPAPVLVTPTGRPQQEKLRCLLNYFER